MKNIRILVQEGMKKALKAAQQPSLSKRDVNTILKAVASQARRIKKTHDELPYGPNRTAEYKKKTPEERKEMQKSYDSLRANIARLGAPFPEGADVIFGDKFGRPDVNPHERGQRIQRGYPPEASGREKLSMTKRGPGFYSFDGSELPTMPDAPSKLNKALKDLPQKVGMTVYRPMRGPLQPDKEVTVRMRGLEDMMKKFSHTSAGRPTRIMVGELESFRNQRKRGEREILKRVDQQRKLKERLPNVVTTNPFGTGFMREGVDNPRDGADVQMKGIRDRLPGRAEATRQAIAKNPKVNPEVITRVVNRLAKSQRDLTQANIRDGIQSDVDPLLADIQQQNRKAVARLAQQGKTMVDQPPPPKPISFREAVEARYKRLKATLDKRIAKDPRVGMHGPSHPMFHRNDLAKRVRQLSKQLKNKPRGKLNG